MNQHHSARTPASGGSGNPPQRPRDPGRPHAERRPQEPGSAARQPQGPPDSGRHDGRGRSQGPRPGGPRPAGPGPGGPRSYDSRPGGQRPRGPRAADNRRTRPSGPQFFAVTPHGLEDALATELHALGIGGARIVPGGVSFSGSLYDAYRVCLWARTAERVLLELARFPAVGKEQIYNGVRAVDWADHLTPRTSIACQAIGMTPQLRNSHYTALVVKDAVVDSLRDRFGERPMVNLRKPDVRLQLLLRGGWALLSLDLSGDALHRRGYRTPGHQTQAPLKETLAAGVLTIAGWPQMAATGGFVDPLCGSGTLPLEAALVAADVAPGLLRHEWGFLRWRGHDGAAWRRAVDEATQRRATGTAALAARARDLGLPPILGFDHDPRAIALARSAILRAGLSGMVAVDVHDVGALRNPFAATGAATAEITTGLVAANPPYGQRLHGPGIDNVYRALGETLRREFRGWRAAVLMTDESRAAQLGAAGVRPAAQLRNGPIPCTLVRFEVGDERATAERVSADSVEAWAEADGAGAEAEVAESVHQAGTADESPEAATPFHMPQEPPAEPAWDASAAPPTDSFAEPPTGPSPEPEAEPHLPVAPTPAAFADAAQQFADRLRRNLRVLGRPLRKRGVDCYRVYDADLPDFNLAVDLYAGWAHVQEYQAPAEIDPAKAAARLQAALAVLPLTLDIEPQHVVLKTRRRQRGVDQYERLATEGDLIEVHEGAATFLVNLTDHIDTGLFLHQRLVRELLGSVAQGRSFLNLFGYTGTATVAAARGGAFDSVTVDLSASYLDWARGNFDRNGLDPALHRTVHADCLRWLRETAAGPQRFDLILLGPPTFSNSTSMGLATLDIQRDHVDLIGDAARLLTRSGVLLFVCGAHRFVFAADSLGRFTPQDLSNRTLPPDFARRAAGHHVWHLSAPVGKAVSKPASARRDPAVGKPSGARQDPAGTRPAGRSRTGEETTAAPQHGRRADRDETRPAAGRSGGQPPRPRTKQRHTKPPWLNERPPGADTWSGTEQPARPAKPGRPSSKAGAGTSAKRSDGGPQSTRPARPGKAPRAGSGPKGGKPSGTGAKRGTPSGPGGGPKGGGPSGGRPGAGQKGGKPSRPGGSGGKRDGGPAGGRAGTGPKGGKPARPGGPGKSVRRRDSGTGGTSRKGASTR